MNSIILNRIILRIADRASYDRFREGCSPEVGAKLLTYTDGMHPFADSLYICDTPDGCADLVQKGYPVAALIHDSNRDLSFDKVAYLIEDPEMISLKDYDHIYRRLSGLPIDILQTERLLIRETSLIDLDRFYEMYDDPEVRNFMEPLYARDEEEAYQESYIKNIYSIYGIGMWTLIRIEDGQLIGRAGIEFTDAPGCVELGFMIDASCRRQGYAYEACSAIIDYARTLDGADRVRARVRFDNTASQDLCRKLGLIPVKELNDGLTEWSMDLN